MDPLRRRQRKKQIETRHTDLENRKDKESEREKK